LHEGLERREFTLYEDDRPVAIVDDALKEQQETEVWNPADTEGKAPKDGGEVPDGKTGEEGMGEDVSGEAAGENGGGEDAPGQETGEEKTPEDGEPITPAPEPTPSTGWIEYDDAWWEEQQGGLPEYNDFYE
ncbi:MAG: hypothetical protein ACI4QX_07995, partial [Lachnospiraceae bacterium]